jgi:hypothetical protein
MNARPKADPTDKSPPLWWLGAALAGVGILWWLNWYALVTKDDRGTFGDMFGAVHSLFTGLAFAVLIYTVWLQRHERALQRKELEATRIELRGQKEQLQIQNATSQRQRFENTFFELVRAKQDVLDSTRIGDKHGRAVFRDFHNELRSSFNQRLPDNRAHEENEVVTVYMVLYNSREQHLGTSSDTFTT